jgi:hypothetical protein
MQLEIEKSTHVKNMFTHAWRTSAALQREREREKRMHCIFDALIPVLASFAQDVHVKVN